MGRREPGGSSGNGCEGSAGTLLRVASPDKHGSVSARSSASAVVAAGRCSIACLGKPNILAIMVDDVTQLSLGAYSHGMTYPTPNIDRLAHEGALFTDHCAQPNCTAGRAIFLMGQLPVRSGLTTVGQPGNPLGIKEAAPTMAGFLFRRQTKPHRHSASIRH
jgi:hypothetical protein